MTSAAGKFKLIEQFRADGLDLMFGNPGTVEQGFLDAADQAPEFHYILSLQETVAAGIADGYARASGGAALLQLHSGVGLGNGIGMMYQSMRGHTRWWWWPATPGCATTRWTPRWPQTWWPWPAR